MSDSLDFNALLQQAQAMQEQLAAAQEAQAEQSVVGEAGGGKVQVTMRGDGQVEAVSIDPDVVDPTDVELLEELLVVALRNAANKVADLQQQAMGGLDLGGLGGLLGGGE